MSDIMDFSPLWGEWHIKEQLGKGSFGSVYRAEKQEYGNTYVSAIKHLSIPSENMNEDSLLADGLISDRRSVKTFYDNVRNQMINEINMCYALRGNTNIVSYEDHCIIEKKDGPGYDIFIRMEYLTPLPKYMAEHKFKEQDVIKLGAEICEALCVLDAHHIIHRDIKPANIFVNSMGVYKLGDFGESKVLSGTSVGMTVRGTYAYMSPEISKGSNANITADIYSLGIVLYRLLNGNKAPFLPQDNSTVTAQTMENANIRRFKGEKIPLPAYHANRGLTSIVMKACEYNPRDRWQSPKEMKKALESLEDDSSANLQGVVGEYYRNQPSELSRNSGNQTLHFSQSSFRGAPYGTQVQGPAVPQQQNYPRQQGFPQQQNVPQPQRYPQQQGLPQQQRYPQQPAYQKPAYPAGNANVRPNTYPAANRPAVPAGNGYQTGNPVISGPPAAVKKKSPAPLIIVLSLVSVIIIGAVAVIFTVTNKNEGNPVAASFGSNSSSSYGSSSYGSSSYGSSSYSSSSYGSSSYGSSSYGSSSYSSSSTSSVNFSYVGTWYVYDVSTREKNGQYMAFKSDGTFFLCNEDVSIDSSGIWREESSGRVCAYFNEDETDSYSSDPDDYDKYYDLRVNSSNSSRLDVYGKNDVVNYYLLKY